MDFMVYLGADKQARPEAAGNELPTADRPSVLATEAALKKPTPFPLTNEEIARFWSKVDRSGGPDACWPWIAGRSTGGYGIFSCKRPGMAPKHSAHRIAYTITHGHSIGDESCCHACDNRWCCNPAHLWLGTHLDNMHDRDAKGRHYCGGPNFVRHGEDHPKAKLTEDDVREIRRLYVRGVVGYRSLGQRFGVTAMVVKAIVTRRTWKDVR